VTTTPRPKARQTKRPRAGEAQAARVGEDASAGENAAQRRSLDAPRWSEGELLDGCEVFLGAEGKQNGGAPAEPRPRLKRLEEVLSLAFDGNAFVLKRPRWFLQSVADAFDEPDRSRMLGNLAGGIGRLRHKMALAQTRIRTCDDLSALEPEVTLLCALEALGIPPAEAHDMLKGIAKRPEHLREHPRQANPRRDHLVDFLVACCRRDERGTVTSRTFHDTYCQWCQQRGPMAIGGEPFTEKALSVEMLKSAGVTRCRLTVDGKKARGLRGIVLRK